MYYLGLDLGTRQDHSAVALARVVDEPEGRYDYAHWRQPMVRRVRVSALERLRLGMSYRGVVARVREIVRRPEVEGRCVVVADATGVGLPVVEMLREGDLRAQVVAVTITAGSGGGHRSGAAWSVPRTELLGGLIASLEKGLVRVEKGARDWAELRDEIKGMKAGPGRGSGHDDLVFALALACWRARLGSAEAAPGGRLL